MKHLIMWGTLIVVSIIAYFVFTKTSVWTSLWESNNSPIYMDLIFIALGLDLAIGRIIAVIPKIFK